MSQVKDGKVVIRADTGLYNAGIVGLMQFMDFLNYDGYETIGSELSINTDFFERNLAVDYLDFIDYVFGQDCKITKLLNEDLDTLGEDGLKKNYDNYLKRKTPVTVCEIYEDTEFQAILKNYPKDRLNVAKTIKAYLTEHTDLYRYLRIAEAVWGNFQFFYNGFGFLKFGQGNYSISKSSKFEEAMDDRYFDLLRKQVTKGQLYDDENNNYACLQCREQFGKVRYDVVEMTMVKSYVDDMGKKKSTFWNKNPDSFLCPLCAFVYCFLPFGFFCVDTGAYYKDRLFINRNNSLAGMRDINVTIAETYKKDSSLKRQDAVNLMVKFVTEQKSEQEEVGTELIALEYNEKRCFYSNKIIGKDILDVIRNADKFISAIVTSKIKAGDEYINIYAEVMNNIMCYNSQWLLLKRLLRYGVSPFVTERIILIQVIQNSIKEKKDMGVNMKTVYRAKADGSALRNFLGKDAENKIRGYVYKLVNALGTGNTDDFLDAVTRMYSGLGKEIPDVLINVYSDAEFFKQIGYAYVVGLQSAA